MRKGVCLVECMAACMPWDGIRKATASPLVPAALSTFQPNPGAQLRVIAQCCGSGAFKSAAMRRVRGVFNMAACVPSTNVMNPPPPNSGFSISTLRWNGSPDQYTSFLVLYTPSLRVIQKRSSAKRSLMRLARFWADIFELRFWRRADPIASFLLAAYVAAMAQPLVYGSLGASVVALMTPVK